MRCPFCRGRQNRVVDSRMSGDGATIRRRRMCSSCERRFTTYERVEESAPMVVKKDNRREAYERSKVLARSEERRVGKECRCPWTASQGKERQPTNRCGSSSRMACAHQTYASSSAFGRTS